MKRGTLFRDERGVTTVGMAVALLVSIALVFTSAQVYRIGSASAEVQEVADAAALAAEGEVAKFMLAVRTCDAVVLSLSLLAVSAYGLGVTALCVPAAEGLSVKLIDLGNKVLEARDNFADRAANGLNAVQRALPFLATASAAQAALANNATGALPARYFAVAVLVPGAGEEIRVDGAGSVRDFGRDLSEDSEALREAARQAEQAADDANDAKMRGFVADCGAFPGYCMFERAQHLANLPDGQNPLYRSVDAWSFTAALERARAYYAARAAIEGPREDESVAEQANAILRKRFYQYASEQLSGGYVRETEDSFSCYFPHLFRSTDELRATELYDQAVYPITQQGSTRVMHAWQGCPQASGSLGWGSLRELDAGGFERCAYCEFTVSSMGNVAAASTSIDNGFEFHYEAMAQAARDYELARAKLDPKMAEVKGSAGEFFERCGALARDLGGRRIEASPPGSKGAVAMVVNQQAIAADYGFESSFVVGGKTLGVRAAVSGATLVEDSSHDEATLITSLLDGLGPRAGNGAVGAARVLLDCWSGVLRVFGEGQKALSEGISRALDTMPLASKSGLGSWAAKALSDAFGALGLEPANLHALKPVLVNSGHITAGDGGAFSIAFQRAKRQALSVSSPTGALFSGLVDDIEAEAYDQLDALGEGVVVAVVEFPLGGLSVPLKLALPPLLVQEGKGFIEQSFDALRSVMASAVGERVWG